MGKARGWTMQFFAEAFRLSLILRVCFSYKYYIWSFIVKDIKSKYPVVSLKSVFLGIIEYRLQDKTDTFAWLINLFRLLIRRSSISWHVKMRSEPVLSCSVYQVFCRIDLSFKNLISIMGVFGLFRVTAEYPDTFE